MAETLLDTKQTVCSACRGTKIRRSHRSNLLESFLSLFQVYPYRCEDCGARFFRKRHRQHVPKERTKAPGSLLARGSKRRQQNRLSRTRREVILYALGMLAFVLFLYYVTHEHSSRPAD